MSRPERCAHQCTRFAAPMHLDGVEQKADRDDHHARGNADHQHGDRIGERPHPQRRDDVLAAEHAAKQGAEQYRHEAAGNQHAG